MKKQKKAMVLCLLFSLMLVFIFGTTESFAHQKQRKCSKVSVKICSYSKGLKGKLVCKKKFLKKNRCFKNLKNKLNVFEAKNRKHHRKEKYYLKILLINAKEDLKKSRVYSKALEGKLVSDVIPSKMVIAISINENIDRKLFKKKNSSIENIVKEKLSEIGLKYDEFSGRVSADGAKGLFQHTHPSYMLIFKRYPRARLLKNFNRAMNDEHNAAKASILHLDNDLAFLKELKKNFSESDIKIIRRYLAASYNCGAPRVKKAVRKHGKNWEKHLPLETRIYLKNFDKIWNVI